MRLFTWVGFTKRPLGNRFYMVLPSLDVLSNDQGLYNVYNYMFLANFKVSNIWEERCFLEIGVSSDSRPERRFLVCLNLFPFVCFDFVSLCLVGFVWTGPLEVSIQFQGSFVRGNLGRFVPVPLSRPAGAIAGHAELGLLPAGQRPCKGPGDSTERDWLVVSFKRPCLNKRLVMPWFKPFKHVGCPTLFHSSKTFSCRLEMILSKYVWKGLKPPTRWWSMWWVNKAMSISIDHAVLFK